MSEGKWVVATPLGWAQNKRLSETFPTYREYVLWAEEVIERIEDLERILGRRN